MVPERPPDQGQPVVIASATRSGSTLLQRVLNTHPEVTIWGEHMGILAEFRRAVEAAHAYARILAKGYAQRSNLIGQLVDAEPFSPHINPFDAQLLRAQVRDFVLRLFADPLPTGTTWGFKEVRYFSEDLEFVAGIFPSARFFVLARDPAAQISSYVRAPWRTKPDLDSADGIERLRRSVADAARAWTRQYDSLRQFATRHEDTSMVLTSDRLSDPCTPAELFAHIGREPPDAGTIRSVVSRRTGSSDASTEWTADDRALLDQLIAAATFPPEHDDVRSFFFGDRQETDSDPAQAERPVR